MTRDVALNTHHRRLMLFVGLSLGSILYDATWPGAHMADSAKVIYWCGFALFNDWLLEKWLT